MSPFSVVVLGVLFGLRLLALVALAAVVAWLGGKLVFTSNTQGAGRLWSWVMYLFGAFLLLFVTAFVYWWPRQTDPFRTTLLGPVQHLLCTTLVVVQIWAVGYLLGRRLEGHEQ